MIESLLVEYEKVGPLRGLVLLAYGTVHLANGDYDQCLTTLHNVELSFGVDHFIRSRQMMAAIHYTKLKDRKRYADCYR